MDEMSPSEPTAESEHSVPSVEGKQADSPSLLGRATLYATLAIVGTVADLWTKQAIFEWRGLPGEKDIWWVRIEVRLV